jgi:hypothetical protein
MRRPKRERFERVGLINRLRPRVKSLSIASARHSGTDLARNQLPQLERIPVRFEHNLHGGRNFCIRVG